MNKSIRPDTRFKPKPIPPVPVVIQPAAIGRKFGIIYVAYGDLAKKSCELSLKSAKKMHPGVPVAVISDIHIPGADVDVIQSEGTKGAREYKTQTYHYTPFEYTLYLDADTLVVGSLAAGFVALQAGWDIAAALDYRQSLGRVDHLPENDKQATIERIGTGEFPHYNTGMLFYRKSPETERLFDLWFSEWGKFKYRDQGAFIRAFHQSDAKLWTLAWQWNTHRPEKATHLFHNHHAVDRELQKGNQQWHQN